METKEAPQTERKSFSSIRKSVSTSLAAVKGGIIFVLSVGMLGAGAHLLEIYAKQMQSDQDEKRRLALHHKEYSACMRTMYKWNNKHKENASSEFKKQMESDSTPPETEAVNNCRSLCKDYWCAQFDLMNKRAIYTQAELDELRGSHSRFVEVVSSLDVLHGYSQQERRVYNFPLDVKPWLVD